MRNCMAKIKNLLLSRKHCIYVRSFEETAFIEDLQQVAREVNMNLLSWKFTQGMARIPLNQFEPMPDNKVEGHDTLSLYAEIYRMEREEPETKNIILLPDFHHFFSPNNAGVNVRAIRDLKEKPLLDTFNPFIIVAPYVHLPFELQKLFVVVDYDLPTKDELYDFALAWQEQIKASVKAGRKNYIIPSNEDCRKLANAAAGLTKNELSSALSLSLVTKNQLSATDVFEYKKEMAQKSGLLTFIEPKITMEEIGGNEHFKQWVDMISVAFSEEAQEFGIKYPKGYLAVGVPGCVKTTSAQAVAAKFNMLLAKLDISKVMHSRVGESEQAMAEVLKTAKACQPCCLLIDESDKSVAGVASSNKSDSGVMARVFEQLLEFMQEDNQVFMILTANDVSSLPPEFTRNGRLNSQWYFPLPNEAEREAILNIHLKKVKVTLDEFSVKNLAKKLDGYTGSDIEEIVNNALLEVFRKKIAGGTGQMTYDDLYTAAGRVVPIGKSNPHMIACLEDYCRSKFNIANELPELGKNVNTSTEDMGKTEVKVTVLKINGNAV